MLVIWLYWLCRTVLEWTFTQSSLPHLKTNIRSCCMMFVWNTLRNYDFCIQNIRIRQHTFWELNLLSRNYEWRCKYAFFQPDHGGHWLSTSRMLTSWEDIWDLWVGSRGSKVTVLMYRVIACFDMLSGGVIGVYWRYNETVCLLFFVFVVSYSDILYSVL